MTAPKVAPKVGDRVRVEYEATYFSGGTWPAHVVEFKDGGEGDYDYRAGVPSFAKITVLPPPVQVGDVATREVLDALPIGSAIVDAGGYVMQLTTFYFERRWVCASRHKGEYGPETVATFNAKVIYIPDPQ